MNTRKRTRRYSISDNDSNTESESDTESDSDDTSSHYHLRSRDLSKDRSSDLSDFIDDDLDNGNQLLTINENNPNPRQRVINKIINEVISSHQLSPEHSTQLENICNMINQKDITLHKILSSNLSIQDKCMIVEQYIILLMLDPFSDNYISLRDTINSRLYSFGENLSDNQQRQLNKIIQLNNDNKVSLSTILSANISLGLKYKLLEDYKAMSVLPITLYERDIIGKSIRRDINCMTNGTSTSTYNEQNIDVIIAEIKASGHSDEVKNIILREVELIKVMSPSSEEYHKQMRWLMFAMKIPTHIKKFPIDRNCSSQHKLQFEQSVRDKLDKKCYGLNEVKDIILDYIFGMISNPSSTNYIIALHGPKGVGKTNIANIIAECLERPIIKLCLGGTHDSSKLVGHSRTYVGAVPGEIVSGLSKSKYCNPVIYIDEIDKVSSTRGSNNEIIGTLIHILDPMQNSEFMDDYLGFPIDLSHVLWILSFNDKHSINPILLDRMFLIDIPKYTTDQKVEIAQNYLIRQIEENLKIKSNVITINKDSLKHLINVSEKEDGIRNLKHNLEFIYRRLNRYYVTKNNKKLKLNNNNNITITESIIDEFIKTEEKSQSYLRMYT